MWFEIREVRRGLSPKKYGQNYVVIGFEKLPMDKKPVVAQCRYFDELKEAEAYKAKRETEGRCSNGKG